MERSPTGELDGVIHFKEADLRTSAGTIRLSYMPAGDVPLIFFPSAPANSEKIYSGEPTPVFCSIHPDDATKRVFKCKHVKVPANEKTGAPATLCSQMWIERLGVTTGTFLSHIRSQHWNFSATSSDILAGQQHMKSFFSAKKKKHKPNHGTMDDATNDETLPGDGAAVAEAEDMQIDKDGEGENEDGEDVVTTTKSSNDDNAQEATIVLVEHLPCRGIHYSNFTNLNFGVGYDFVT